MAFVPLARNSYLLSKIKYKSISCFQLMFQLFEESSNNRPKIFPHVLTHCVISYIIPSPTLALAASNEHRPFLSCFLAAHMPNSNCSPGKDKSQLPIENPERSSVRMYTLFTGQDLRKLPIESHSKCSTAHTWGRIQCDPAFNTNRISAAISQSFPLCFFLNFSRIFTVLKG